MQEKQSNPKEQFTSLVSHVIAAEEIGEKAAKLTSQQGFSGSAVAVGSAAVYLEGPGDGLFWLTKRSVFLHRRSIRGPFSFKRITSGLPFLIKERILLIGDHFRLDLSPANRRPLLGPDPRNVAAWSATKERILKFLNAIKQVEGAKGLGMLLSLNPGSLPNREPSSMLSGEFIKQSSEIIRQIAVACYQGHMKEIAQHSQQLIGLGPGLTPSGDDFIGGMFFVFQWLEAAYPQKCSWDSVSKERLMASARAGTNKISFTVLSDLAQGHGPMPLHSLLSSLFLGERVSDLLKQVHSLVRIGHSSGWDMLAGVATGLLITCSSDELQ